jgi:hypothetical protein
MEPEAAQQIAIHNLAKSASRNHDLAIGTAFPFRLPPELRAIFQEELEKFQDGQQHDKENTANNNKQ